MGGKVMRTLRICPWMAPLTHAELLELASCGQVRMYEPQDMILRPEDERLFILRRGRVALHVRMESESDRCGGEADFELDKPGDAFGWATWARPDRIVTSARALDLCEMVTVDLERIRDPTTLSKLGLRMVQNLFARLQEGGLCPPNVRAFLKLGEARCIFPETSVEGIPW